ncbi:hypothetical protein AAG570_010045 [Ranatra chinensis]|uniref:Uncharacterized protein n=1 Tax=Ranatra chinensis TaxID=642074 RepID=A0ABD0YXL2_9HEMI
MNDWPRNYALNFPYSGPITITPTSLLSEPMTAPYGTLLNVSSDHILPHLHFVVQTTPGPDRMQTKRTCLPIIYVPYFSPSLNLIPPIHIRFMNFLTPPCLCLFLLHRSTHLTLRMQFSISLAENLLGTTSSQVIFFAIFSDVPSYY